MTAQTGQAGGTDGDKGGESRDWTECSKLIETFTEKKKKVLFSLNACLVVWGELEKFMANRE